MGFAFWWHVAGSLLFVYTLVGVFRQRHDPRLQAAAPEWVQWAAAVFALTVMALVVYAAWSAHYSLR